MDTVTAALQTIILSVVSPNILIIIPDATNPPFSISIDLEPNGIACKTFSLLTFSG